MIKKLIVCILLLTAGTATVNADTLFPWFVDLVGDYTEIKDTGASCWMKSPKNGGGEKAATQFLEDTLPSGTYRTTTVTLADGTKVKGYVSDMLDRKVSVIYFITQPDGTFSIEYAEGTPDIVLKTFNL